MNNLIFFNKEGYPHNFQYNQDTEGWEGKIIFDENSDQTFKNQSLHIFENVDSIDFNINADLVKIDYFNNSGLTFAGETKFQSELITNIIKVNESSDFYSKWIYGDDFHRKFPVGTIVSFSGVTGTTSYSSDFSDDQFFTVLAVKKNAFLIITNTNNDIFTFDYIYSGYTNSLNMISINDYNRNLSGDTFIQNLYTDKKFSIVESIYNDTIVSVKQTGETVSYLNELTLSGIQNDIFTLKTQFFTERPKILQNDIYLSGATIMNLGKMSNQLAPEVIYNSDGSSGLTKKEIIFQDDFGNPLFSGSSFTVESLVNTSNIGVKILTFKKYYDYTDNIKTQWNTIQFSGTTNLKSGDIISIVGSGLNDNRNFNISNISFSSNSGITVLFTPDYIIEENSVYYDITQKLKNNQIRNVIVTPTGDITDFIGVIVPNASCYLTSTIISFSQRYSSGSTNSMYYNTINSFINKYKTTFYNNGIDIYYSLKNGNYYLSIESLYGSKTTYFYCSGYTNGVLMTNDYSLTNNGITTKYNIITNEKLINEYTNKSDTRLYQNQVPNEIAFNLNNDNNRFGFRLTLNGNEYFTNFTVNTQTTINSFIDIYGDILYKNGFNVSSGYSSDYSTYTLKILSNIDIWELKIVTNILSSYNIIERVRNNFIVLSGNEIRTLSSLFDIGLATGMIVKISGSSYSENNKEYNIINLTQNSISLSYQGVFNSENSAAIYGKTREYIRKPRGEYDRDVYFRVYWEVPYDTVIDESIFLYDISGEQLVPYNNNPELEYKGPKPLISQETNCQTTTVFLNDEPNKYLSEVYNPSKQQTVFDELIFKLEQLDSSSSYNWVPEPLEIFMGYNSPIEGTNTRTLKIDRIEKNENSDNYFVYSGYTNSGSSININNFIFSGDTITYVAPADFSFISYGFKSDQLIMPYFKDQSKINQRIFENAFTYKIKSVFRNKIVIDTGYTYNVQGIDTGTTVTTSGFTYFNSTGATFLFKIEIQPKEVLSCINYGQTEIEDIRYKVNLNNVGVKSEEDVYQILYASDIEDNAIDFTLFNRKRKEMLTTFREIYDYIGSYKALINAINYFGYNDLQLYEYYKNIDKSSYLYKKLHKVLIPDIFDNTVEGWNEIDFIAGKYQQQNIWKKTNLFNLSYRITDEEGNNVLIYSLDEVQYKLTKLKKWLRENIIPVSANLVDITGVVDTKETLYQDYDESNQTIKSVINRNSTVVNFNYTATLNFDDNYLVTVNFYTMSGATGTTIDYNDVPVNFSAKIKTFYLSGCTNNDSDLAEILVPVQYFKINKNDLKPFSFNLNRYVDPYIYIETTTYDNDGSGLGYVNNKLFYFDEPRNFWLVTHNFDIHQMKYYQFDKFIDNKTQNTSILFTE